MFSPRSASRPQPQTPSQSRPLTRDLPIVLATSIATEYASLSTPSACPSGVYVTPSNESLLIWDGVLFVHEGPYADAIMRFSILFERDYPNSRPVIKFGPDVYHPMVDPKTMIWSPRRGLANWQPGKHHVTHLLHALRGDFQSSALDDISEDEATNKQLFLLYKNSRHTFLSMTAQRSRNSSAPTTLFPYLAIDAQKDKVPSSPTGSTSTASKTGVVPSTPTKQIGTGRVRQTSDRSLISTPGYMVERDEGMIRFKQLDAADEEKLWLEIRSKFEEKF